MAPDLTGSIAAMTSAAQNPRHASPMPIAAARTSSDASEPHHHEACQRTNFCISCHACVSAQIGHGFAKICTIAFSVTFVGCFASSVTSHGPKS